MLRHLHVTNLAVVESASVEFEPGLNVLTGETGAGKSLVVDSLQLLGGARASSDLLRTGADRMTVSGVFDLPASSPGIGALETAGIECADRELVIRREVTRSGRNRVFVNDQPATLRLLAEIAPALLRVHGQRDELGLVSADQQRAWVDREGGAAGVKALEECARLYQLHQTAASRLERLIGNERELKERIDLLRFQASEIAAAGLVVGEERQLRSERDGLRHAEEISAALSLASLQLREDDDAVTSRLARAHHALETIADWQQGAADWLAEIEDARIRMEEVGAAVASLLSTASSEPGRLDAIEDRLATLERLFRKYGSTSEEVLARETAMRDELSELEVDEDKIEELQQEVASRLEDYRKAARKLSKKRQTWARRLEKRMAAELSELALQKARLEIGLSVRGQAGSPLEIGGEPVEMHPWGYDHITYHFSSNPGEEARPLAKVASGGELSRVYLALQTAAHRPERAAALQPDPPTLVFDEVDSGVGGAAAAVVGRKLRRLGGAGQILAVTHLPQVASRGHHHLRIEKQTRGERTQVSVEPLDAEARIEEVARMLGSEEITSAARKHAAGLIAEAKQA